MVNEKVTTLEDRIPKLKQQRKQKTNQRMIIYISFFFLLILLIVYFQSPLSNVKTIEIKGNEVVSRNQILSITDVSNDTSFWSVNSNSVESDVERLVQVNQARVEKAFPNKVLIKVSEYKKVAFLEKEGKYYPVLQNGETLPEIHNEVVPTNAPILVQWEDGKFMKMMAEQLNELPQSIRVRISEVHYTPREDNNQHISLFMNDGYEVVSTISKFAHYMQYYPSIVQKLDGKRNGVIHLTGTPRFESYE